MVYIVLDVGDGLSAGIGRFAAHMDRIIMMVVTAVLFIQWVLIILHQRKRNNATAMVLRIFSLLFAFFPILLYQNEVGFYISGTFILISSFTGTFLSFLK